MDFTKNVTFIDTINTSVKAIMKNGKLDKHDIPTLVLLITELITTSNSSSSTGKITNEQMTETINMLYNYIMTHYNLLPDDEGQKADIKLIFDTCVKLTLFQPNINKKTKTLFACLG